MSKLTDEDIKDMYEDAINTMSANEIYMTMPEVIIQLIDRLRDAERRLAVPVKLPPMVSFKNDINWRSPNDIRSADKEAILTAGFKVEGE